MLKHTGRGFLILALLVAGSLYALKPNFGENAAEQGLKRGIDLIGGTELVYEIDLDDVPSSSRATIVDDVKMVITNRFDAFGLKEISIATAGRDRLIIQLPGFDNAELQRMKQQIERSGELSFHLESADQDAATVSKIENEWNQYRAAVRAGQEPTEPSRSVAKTASGGNLVLESGEGSSVGGEWLQNASYTTDETGAPAIQFSLSGNGAVQFGEMTGTNVGKYLCIVLDSTVIQRAVIETRIDSNGRITGSFSKEEVDDTVTLLRAGSLPAKPQLVNEQTVGALLGKDSVNRGTKAMGVGFTLVVIFMLVYYMGAGIVANIALFLNLLFLLAAMQIFRNTLTFPGMAGLLLTVGMAVDANILIFARIREEKARGRGLAQAVQAGYQRAFSTIFDANVTTLITAYILFKFGSGAVKGFAVVLSIGIIASFFTSIYISRLFLTVMIKRGLVKELKMMALFTKVKIDFMAKTRPFAMASAACITIGLLVLVARGKDTLGIDFTGGSRLITTLQVAASEGEIRDLISGITDQEGKKTFDDVQVQILGPSREEAGKKLATSFSIRTSKIGQSSTKVEGGGTTESSATDLFRQTVATALGEPTAAHPDGLLAPDGIAHVETIADPPTFTAVLNIVTDERNSAGLTSSFVEGALRDANFPVVSVSPLDSIANGSIQPFQIVATKNDQYTVFELESLLGAKGQEMLGEKYSLSTPFPEVNSIGGRVAQDMQGKVFVSMMIAFFVIVFYISLRFRFQFGLAAIVALVHDICIVLGALAIADLLIGSFISLKINLPVIAALLTTVGYSLNDTIVIFDRIRENLAGKKRDVNYSDIVNLSINQTLSRTILTSATTFIVVMVLLLFGGEGLAAFSFALVIGVVVGTYSSIFIACPALLYFHKKSLERRDQILAEAAAAK